MLISEISKIRIILLLPILCQNSLHTEGKSIASDILNGKWACLVENNIMLSEKETDFHYFSIKIFQNEPRSSTFFFFHHTSYAARGLLLYVDICLLRSIKEMLNNSLPKINT